jgi:hypothetical protein
VQLFVSPAYGSTTPPVKRLRRFAKVTLAAGESRELHFKLGRDDAPGPFTARIGSLSREITVK